MKKIVIVDDEPDIRNTLKILLKKYGYDVHLAENGELGLEIITKIIPDLVFIDVILPGINGFELCRIIKQNDVLKNIPVVIFSAIARESDKKIAAKSGANYYLKKPYTNKNILKIIDHFINKKEEKKNYILKEEHIFLKLFAVMQKELNKSGTKLHYKKIYEDFDNIFTLPNNLSSIDEIIEFFNKNIKNSFNYIQEINILNKIDQSSIIIDVDGCSFAHMNHRNINKENYTCPVGLMVGYLLNKYLESNYVIEKIIYRTHGCIMYFSEREPNTNWIKVVKKAA